MSSASVVLLVGTKRGLFVVRSDRERKHWTISPPRLVGLEVFHAVLDPRDLRTAWAATGHKVWGAHIYRSTDCGETWEVLAAAPHHPDSRGLEAIWHLAPGHTERPNSLFAGIEPAGLFRSDDAGDSWQGIDSLNQHATRDSWQPAGGSLALGSILVDPRNPDRLYCALSAGGVYRSENGGANWQPANRGLRADFLPIASAESGHCVHKMLLHPQRPDRLYQQNHCGVYRSDDRAEHWTEITDGLPSDFGYALAVHPRDPDTLFVIPEESSHMRTTVGGRLRVFRSHDAGATWQPLEAGLPQRDAYVSVLREGLSTDSLEPAGVYFGTSGGHLFASRDAGQHWELIAGFLPRILSVSAAVVD